MMRIAYVVSHPIQYHAPMFRAFAQVCDLTVLFAHRQTANGQAQAGYGVAFEWDIDLLGGYTHRFLRNDARRPAVDRFWGIRSRELRGVLAAGQYDAVVVSGWNLMVYWQAVFACRKLGIPVLARTDSHLSSPRRRLLRVAKALMYPRLLRYFDGFFAVGERSRAYLRHYGVDAARIHYAQHVVDRARFARDSALDDATRLQAKSALGLPLDRAVVLFVGRLIPWKRVSDAILAIASMDASRRPALLVVGDGAEREALATLANLHDVCCRFAGFCNQRELPSRYALADVLVLPSDGNETWGLVANEAIACGVPVVVSDRVGCAEELVVAGRAGLRFPMGDTRALAGALGEVLEHGRAHYAEALLTTASAFSAESAAQSLLAGLNTLQPQRGVRSSPVQ